MTAWLGQELPQIYNAIPGLVTLAVPGGGRQGGQNRCGDYPKEFPAGMRAMAELERAIHDSALEPGLLELVKIRASQINGCAYCLAMHNRDARACGEHATRLDTIAAWREVPYYSARERATLAWCEALTELPGTEAPDEVYAAAETEFTAAEIAALTFSIVAINGWNRLAVGLGAEVTTLDGLDLPGEPAHARGPERVPAR